MPPDAESKIRAFLGKATRDAVLDGDADIFESGIVNSLFAVELVAFTEKEFDIVVEDDDLDLANFRSINALRAFVERKAKAA